MSQQGRRRPKTRFLTTYEFFEIVQIEYICSILRARVYPKPKDKEYWNKVAEGKKRTIETIANRNRLPSIFTDSDLEAALSRRVYRENTFPIFCYRDEEQKLNQEYFDLLYYYSKGIDVRFDIGNGIQVGKVKQYTPFDKNLTIEVDGVDIKVPVKDTVRIL